MSPDLAWSLNNLCRALSKLRRHSEVLPSVKECVKFYRELVTRSSPSHMHSEAPIHGGSVKFALSDLGRHEEALPFIEESVKLYRELVANDPDHTPQIWPSRSTAYVPLFPISDGTKGRPYY
ncbi:uncharacterized protein EI90DRAFT_3133770 [Cantharellus anzutake]|uniref:uncharacterized protein n=1 Tax=Cantharellus anzutake TaxID=1750568 RepID=UPI0019080527|nr:uncharacterized protein EI90DRAFT_3133770 [Cantharellus anzutake]KAF8317528.1 hypothetical protein EI90DRAFT_3133770 [Cantharellus anzutake]